MTSLSNLPAGSRDDVGLDMLRFGQTPPPAIPESRRRRCC
jgi:hypothetical protein